MELTITSALALFVLLALAAVTYYLARRFHVPYTVLLVAVGIALVPLVHLPGISQVTGFLDDLVLTPELLFLIFLPILIFESGYGMSMRLLVDNAWTVILLAVVGLLISAFLIAGLLALVLGLVGVAVPFTVLLLFGSIISATDPVAVLALFKDVGAPRRLTIIFEGESLFNDGTAVALFFVVLGVVTGGFDGTSTVLIGALEFAIMVALGVGLGLAAAAVLGIALRHTRTDQFVAATLLMISAHLVFITGELINESHLALGTVDIRVSSIIATTVSALFLGTYARHALSPTTDDYVDKAVEHLAFVANSLVFLLAGLLFASIEVPFGELWLPMVLSVLVVAFSRAVSVAVVTRGINAARIEGGIPRPWEALLAWGSLRGALAIIVVLLIPTDLQIPGWGLATSPRDFLLALTISCILVTLFLKAPLIAPLMRRLHVGEPEHVDQARRNTLAAYYLQTERAGFRDSETREILHDDRAQGLLERVEADLEQVRGDRAELLAWPGPSVFERSLWLQALAIEEVALRQLYVNQEVGEATYRRLHGKLQLQREFATSRAQDALDEHRSRDRKDVFDAMVTWVSTRMGSADNGQGASDRIESARAQLILSRRVVRILDGLQQAHPLPVFPPVAYDLVVERYRHYDVACAAALVELSEDESAELAEGMVRLGLLSQHAWGQRAIATLQSHGLCDHTDELWLLSQFSPDRVPAG